MASRKRGKEAFDPEETPIENDDSSSLSVLDRVKLATTPWHGVSYSDQAC